MALKLRILGAAQIKDENATPADLAKQMDEISEPRSPENKVVEWISKEMRYNEKHGQNYAKEWVEYFAKYGT